MKEQRVCANQRLEWRLLQKQLQQNQSKDSGGSRTFGEGVQKSVSGLATVRFADPKGPRQAKIDQKGTIWVHFGLGNAEMQFRIRPFDQNGRPNYFDPVHFPAVLRRLLRVCEAFERA